ncbi:MAG: ATP-dependent DNA helicase RecG [Peptococcaceae bacterium]|nr:ATP-dependent DNA helicase RecG [Peptococcaceae bacterium]
MSNNDIWCAGLQSIDNIGPKRAELFRRVGIDSLEELLHYFPREFEDRTETKAAEYYNDGEQVFVIGKVLSIEEKRLRLGLKITRVYFDDGFSGFVGVWYNQPYIARNFPIGKEVLITGRLKKIYKENQIQVKDYHFADEGNLLSKVGIMPIYSLTEGLSQQLVRKTIKDALNKEAIKIAEYLPEEILKRYLLPEIRVALNNMHFPSSLKELKMARRRFVFEELFLHQIIIEQIKAKSRVLPKNHTYSEIGILESTLLDSLPFRLTSSQEAVWDQIHSYMVSSSAMNVLLQGDVGSGKTVISILAMLKAVGQSYQAALMIPTEILAVQHYYSLKKYLEPLGVRITLLTGGIKKNEKPLLLNEIKEGKADIIVGTHALIQKEVEFKKLALVVIDEQHRFGVKHRAMLREKGDNPDLLIMSATPIPGTLAMTLYGDLDICTITELPPGRKSVDTELLDPSQIDLAYQVLRKEIAAGGQGYIVCPLVEDSEKTELQSVVKIKMNLESGILKDCRISILHGRMKNSEKDEIMLSFRQGLIDVLISTTVIEVGLDVPNASVMIITDAHRFGIAQLHQLRGRVGRSDKNSRCYLVSEEKESLALSRLQALCSTDDGFILAEKDLELRGPGDFFSSRQWGSHPFKVANPLKDVNALVYATKDAKNLIEKDLELGNPEHRFLAEEINRLKLTALLEENL